MTNIEEFFIEHLDGRMAHVSSDGLFLEGTLEQKCKLDFIQYNGLNCSIELEQNNSEVVKQIEQILIQNKENLSITNDERDALINLLIPQIKKMFVRIGIIFYYGIEGISSSYNEEGHVVSVEIKYKKGSTIYIRSIE